MNRYRLSPDAEADLEDIEIYLTSRGGTQLSRYVLSNLRDALYFLSANPQAGHRREDLTDEAVKFWSVFPI